MADNVDFDTICDAFNRPYEGVRPEIIIDVASSSKRSELVSDILKTSEPEFRVNLLWGNRGGQKIDCSHFSKIELTKFLCEGHYIVLKEFKGIPFFGLSIWENGVSLHFKTGEHWSFMVVLKFLNFLKKVLLKYSPVKVVIDEKSKFFSDREIMLIYAAIKGRAR